MTSVKLTVHRPASYVSHLQRAHWNAGANSRGTARGGLASEAARFGWAVRGRGADGIVASGVAPGVDAAGLAFDVHRAQARRAAKEGRAPRAGGNAAVHSAVGCDVGNLVGAFVGLLVR
jgi:hypothetical protein